MEQCVAADKFRTTERWKCRTV